MKKTKIWILIFILLIGSVLGSLLNVEREGSAPLEKKTGSADNNGSAAGRGRGDVAQTAYAEISPVIIETNVEDQQFCYYIATVMGPGDTGFDTIRIEIPGVYSNITVTGILVDGVSADHTDNTQGSVIELVLDVKVTTNGRKLRVDFTADTPDSVDWGSNFTSTLKDSGHPDSLACVSGDGDGGGNVTTDTWTVRTDSPHGTFVQTHWTDSGFASQSGLVTSQRTGLRLASDPSNMVMLYDFDTDTANRPFYQLWGMAEYRGELYISVCKSTMESGNRGYVYAYDGVGGTTMVKKLNEDGMWKIRAFDDKLYVPGHDTALGDKRARIHIYDGGTDTWDWNYVTQFQADHNMDIEKYQGRLYVSNCQINSQSGVWVSSDEGETWSQSYSYPQWGIDKLKAFNGNLYLGNSLYRYPDAAVVYTNKLVKYDGSSWQEKNIGNPRQEWDAIAGFGVFQDELYLGAMESIFRYDDETDTVTEVKHMDHVTYEFAEHEDNLYAVTGQVYREDLIGNDSAFRKLFPISPFYTDRINNAKLWSTGDGNSWKEVFSFDEDEALSVYSWFGRLYVGTGGDRAGSSPARLYAGTYESGGELISRPYEIESSHVAYERFRFSRQTVENTTVKLQFRTSTTEAGLSGEAFKGPSGTGADFYTANVTDIPALHDNQRWFQYRVLLETANTTYRTPVLESVVITYDANDVPRAVDLALFPADPITTDDLSASYTYVDSEGELGTEIRWYKNGIIQPEYNDKMVIPWTVTGKHEEWYFTVKPRDGIEFGELRTSPTVTIANSKPIIDNLTLAPSDPGTEANLTVGYSYSDLDGDLENGFEIRWYVDGDVRSSLENRTVIPSNATGKGEEWWCTVRPQDGDEFGTQLESPHVRINNTSPTRPLELSPSSGTVTVIEESVVSASWSSSFDPDSSDIIYYTVYGELNNPTPVTLIEAYLEDTSTTLTGLIDNGTYYWRVEAYDGFDTTVSDVVSFNVVINVEPTVSLLSPADGGTVYTSSVTLSWIGEDANGDSPITYDVYLGTTYTSVAWREPSVLVSRSQGSTIYNATGLLNETYYWLVIPNDGFINGSCDTGVWQFTVDVPPPRIYNIKMIADVERLDIIQGGKAVFNITLANNGNVHTTVNLSALGNISSELDIPISVGIPIAGTRKILLAINDTSAFGPGDYELVIEAYYPGGSVTITIPVSITSWESLPPISEDDDKDEDGNKGSSGSFYLHSILVVVFIIVIGCLLFIIIFLRKHKEKGHELPEDPPSPPEEALPDEFDASLERLTTEEALPDEIDTSFE